MSDAIEVMARAMCRDDFAQMGEPDGCHACDGKTKERCFFHGEATKAYEALTASGFIIVTKAERDGVRAAMAEEAREIARKHSRTERQNYGNPELSNKSYDVAINIDQELAALAKTPPKMVCVPVEPTDAMVDAGVEAGPGIDEDADALRAMKIYRAMTAQRSE